MNTWGHLTLKLEGKKFYLFKVLKIEVIDQIYIIIL